MLFILIIGVNITLACSTLDKLDFCTWFLLTPVECMLVYFIYDWHNIRFTPATFLQLSFGCFVTSNMQDI